MIFPRSLSVAERAWHRAFLRAGVPGGSCTVYQGGETHFVDDNALEQHWLRFANLIGQREVAKLNKGASAIACRYRVLASSVASWKPISFDGVGH